MPNFSTGEKQSLYQCSQTTHNRKKPFFASAKLPRKYCTEKAKNFSEFNQEHSIWFVSCVLNLFTNQPAVFLRVTCKNCCLKSLIAANFKDIPQKFVANSWLKCSIPCSKRWASELSWKFGCKNEYFCHSKCVTRLGRYKCNSSSLLNHRLIHDNCLIFQICTQSDFMMVRLRPIVKNKVSSGERTQDLLLSSLWSSFLRHRNCWKVRFCAVNIRLKQAVSSDEASKTNYMGDLHLQLPSTALHLEFGTGTILFLFFLVRMGNVIDWQTDKWK